MIHHILAAIAEIAVTYAIMVSPFIITRIWDKYDNKKAARADTPSGKVIKTTSTFTLYHKEGDLSNGKNKSV